MSEISMERKHSGAHNEMLATVWLLKRGYEVFRNVSSHGIIDLIAVKNGEVSFFDVKGVRKNKGGSFRRALSSEQAEIGVQLLAVLDDDSCEIVESERANILLVHRECEVCGRPFSTGKGNKRFCSPKCRGEQSDKKRRSPSPANDNKWKCPIRKAGCASNCGNYGCGN